jgi:hypothetical protein
MTDLISKVDKLIIEDRETIERLLIKYNGVLEFTLPKKDHAYHAFFINYCINVINQNHSKYTSDWKAWACLMVFKLYQDGKIEKLTDIPKMISDFFKFWEKDYYKYCDDIISVNDYERDKGFAYRFYLRIKR